MIREKNEDLVTMHQQEVMKLRLRLQRSDDEATLAKNDLERSKHRVGDLEQNVLELSRELQEQTLKCKELDEMLVIREAEVWFLILMHCIYNSFLWVISNKRHITVCRCIL